MEFYTTFPENFIEKVNIEHQTTFETERINKFRVMSTLISLDDCIMKLRIELNSDFLTIVSLSEIIKLTVSEWKLHLDPMYYMTGITVGVFKNDSYRWQSEIENDAEEYIAMNVERLLWDAYEEFVTEYVETSN